MIAAATVAVPALGATADVSVPAAASSSTTAPGAIARPAWPCSSCGAAVDVDLDACAACGTGFLGALRTSKSGIELPMIGDLGRFSDKSRIVLGAGAGVAIAFVLVIVIALLGH